MKFTPLRLRAKNFMSYETLDFDFTKHSGLNLITGINKDVLNTANGSGKSVFGQAFAFGLFGKSISGLNNASMVNMSNRMSECECSVDFLVGDVQYRTIWRIVKGTYLQCQIFEEDKDITPPGVAEARQLIETDIIGMNFKNSFLQTVVLTKENCPSFFALPAAQKRIFTETLFNLTVFGKMNDLIRRALLDIAKEILVLQQDEMTNIRTLKQLSEKEAKFVADSQIELDSIKGKIQELIKTLCTLLKVKSGAEVIAKRKILEATIANLVDSERMLTTEHLEAAKKAGGISADITHKTQFIKKYESILACVCETCKHTIESQFGIDDAVESIKTQTEAKAAAHSAELKIKERLVTIQGNLATLRTKASELDAISNEVRVYKSKIEQANAKVSPYAEMISSHSQKIEEIGKHINGKHTLENYHNILAHMTSEDGIKKTVLENLVAVLNSQIEYYLTQLGANYKCEFKSDFECEFTANGNIREFGSFSAGERSRIDIATLFAFKDLLVDQTVIGSSVMLMDEFFDSSLDDYSVSAMLKILKESVKKYNQTIFIISHRELVKNETFSSTYIDNTIVIEKKMGISRIVKDAQGGIT